LKTSSRDHLVHIDGWGYVPDGLDVWHIMQERFAPKNVLEIGFHLGHSTTYQLEAYVDARITTLSPAFEGTLDDACLIADTRQRQALVMKDLFGDRFDWIPKQTCDAFDALETYGPFDFAFIDGQHTYEHSSLDLNCCKHFGVKTLLMDNVDQYQVLQAVNHSKWTMIDMFPYVSDDDRINVMGLLVL